MSDDATQDMTPNVFGWNELVTPDPEAAQAFYCGLFGWSADKADGPNMDYTFFKLGDRPVGGMMKTPAECGDVPPHWMSYVQVESITDTCAKADSLGGKVLVPETQVGEYGFFAVIQDPTGAVFSLWKSK